MRNSFAQWLDDRTSYKALLHEALEEPIPGGARWKYVFGSALTATFAIQFVTGLLLMTSYVPSSSQAWGSVWYISNEMTLGWLIRGIHHFGSSAMIVLLGLHLIQVLIAGAYRKPREVNWWFGMVLMFLTLGFSLTGYLLPWDQKGYWATKVATNIAGGTPGIGPSFQTLLVGGAEYGNQTLTRFYGLHVGILPVLFFMCLIAHVALFRKHGVTHSPNARGEEKFWPKQMFIDLVASVLVFGVILLLVLAEGGANLDAPADPASREYPARPEWYFLALFQLLKYFESPYEVVGTTVVPAAIVTVLLIVPLLDRVLPRGLAHFLACAFIFALVGSAGYLTYEAWRDDAEDPVFQAARVESNEARRRALDLARKEGIPPDGAAYLLQRDPLYHGFHVLESKCLSCHYYDGRGQINTVITPVSEEDLVEAELLPNLDEVLGAFSPPPDAVLRALAAKTQAFQFTVSEFEPTDDGAYHFKGENEQGERMEVIVSADAETVRLATESKQTAADLKDFGARAWIRGLLEDPSSDTYFGKVPQCGQMQSWKDGSDLSDEELDEVADFFAEHVITVQPGDSAGVWEYTEAVQEHPGFAHFEAECINCHAWGMAGIDATGINSPNLFGWGSDLWIERMIRHPGAHDLYGYLSGEDLMPSFDDQLTPNDLRAIIRFLKGDYFPPQDDGDHAHY